MCIRDSQSLVQSSLVVLTRPQTGLSNGEAAWEEVLQQPLPPGPLAWPAPPEESVAEEDASRGGAAEEPPTATTDEGAPMEDGEQ